MNAVDILLIAALVAAAVLAVRAVVRRKKNGGCGCGCAGCTAACPEKGKGPEDK